MRTNHDTVVNFQATNKRRLDFDAADAKDDWRKFISSLKMLAPLPRRSLKSYAIKL
jgi:hypothetical protein